MVIFHSYVKLPEGTKAASRRCVMVFLRRPDTEESWGKLGILRKKLEKSVVILVAENSQEIRGEENVNKITIE